MSSAKAAPATETKQRKLTSKPIPADKTKYSLSIPDTLESLFDKAIQNAYPDVPEATVTITGSKVADYQCNSALAIASVCLWVSFLIQHIYITFKIQGVENKRTKSQPERGGAKVDC